MVRVAQPWSVFYFRQGEGFARCEPINPVIAWFQAKTVGVRSAEAGQVRQGQAPRSLQPVMLMR